METYLKILVEVWQQWQTLLGVAALIILLVNVFKVMGIVKDGQADVWVAALNLIGLIALFATKEIGRAHV